MKFIYWLNITLWLIAIPAMAIANDASPLSTDLPAAPITLTQAIHLAWERNPDMQVAKTRIGSAYSQLKEVTAAFLPHIRAGLSYVSSNDPSRAFGMIVSQRRFNFNMDINNPGFQEDFRPQIGVQWSLFRGGQDYYLRQAAKLGIDASKAQKTAIRNGLASTVSTAYYALLEAPQQLDVARRTMATIEKEIELMRARQAQGMALKSDILSLEVRLAQANNEEIRALNAEESARSALRTLIAVPSDITLQIASKENQVLPDVPGAFSSWLRQAWENRPELLAADKQIEARKNELLAARGARLPRLNVFATYGQNTRNPHFSTSRDNLTMGVQAEMDIFSGGEISARINQASQKLQEAQALKERTQLQVEQEVKQAWLDLREALSQVDVAQRQVTAAEEALRLVRIQYHGEVATITRFLRAETETAAAHLQLIASRFNALIAQAELNRASGIWSTYDNDTIAQP